MKKFSELVLLKKEQALTTSLIVAEYFEKNHFDVLRAIENCLTTLHEVNATSNDSNFAGVKINQSEIGRVENPASKMFQKSTYKDAKGESRPMYYMNRDGFMLLVMGFTGVKAMEIKVQFIEAFNRMEELLLERQSPIWQEARQESKDATREMTDAIKKYSDTAGDSSRYATRESAALLYKLQPLA